MDYTDAELEELNNELDEDHDRFLDEVYIQVLDHKTDHQPIYKGNDLQNPVFSRK